MIVRGNTVGTTMSVDKIAEQIGTGGGGGGGSVAPLILTLDDEWLSSLSGEASHTSVEIVNHMAKGGNVILNALGYGIPVAYASDGQAVFTNMDGTTKVQIVIDSGGYYNASIDYFATESQIGDIASALDELHTYAQGLIEGGAEA